MNKSLIFAVLLVALNAYPIIVYQSGLNRTDLFLSEEQFVQRIKQQSKPVSILNIQTCFTPDDTFQTKLVNKIQAIPVLNNLVKHENTFISPYIPYTANSIITQFEGSFVRNVNFQNLKSIDKLILSQEENIIIIVFSKISSNVKLLEEISSQYTEVVLLQETADNDESESNQISNITSNELTGYLTFFIILFAIWISLQCTVDIQTPERFSKQNFFIGKEN